MNATGASRCGLLQKKAVGGRVGRAGHAGGEIRGRDPAPGRWKALEQRKRMRCLGTSDREPQIFWAAWASRCPLIKIGSITLRGSMTRPIEGCRETCPGG